MEQLKKYLNFICYNYEIQFKDKVYKTVIPRNVRLSEAPSHGVPCIVYDRTCLGSKSYLQLAEEFMNQQTGI